MAEAMVEVEAMEACIGDGIVRPKLVQAGVVLLLALVLYR